MASGQENNKAYNTTERFNPSPNVLLKKTLFVTPDSTGTVTMQTLVYIDGVEAWYDVNTYTSGEGETINQASNIFRFIPSDSTTYYKYG
jgi:hypothetical protein